MRTKVKGCRSLFPEGLLRALTDIAHSVHAPAAIIVEAVRIAEYV